MSTELYTVKEGWLMKRGKYIKNWRPRYFVLRSDGSFLGFKDKPRAEINSVDPLNNFSVERCLIIKKSKPKPNGFIIRCFQLTKFVNRTFAVDSSSDREDWINAIEDVSNRMKKEEKARDGAISSTHDSYDSSKMTLEDFEILKVLGKGTFAKVMLGKEKKTGNVFAIKLLRKDVILAKDEVEHTLTENRVLQSTKHPFLTELKYSFQTPDRLVFVMECVNGGDLFFHLQREKVFSEAWSKFYGAEITLALKYLHEEKIVYRDVKLENLLIDSDGHIKLIDFGLCKQEISFADITQTFCGTPEYLAPEVLEDDHYGNAVDWWGFGVVLYEMLCGRLPFYNRDHEVLFELVLREPVRFPSCLTPQSKSILNGLLEKSPEKRLGGTIRDAEQVMEHEFFELINWNDIFHKKIPPPFKPSIDNKEDVKYFDEDFTRETPRLTPPKDCLDDYATKYFSEFSSFSFVDNGEELNK
ncbi:RAC-beta serine/threonine-protein kinase-like [Hydractinia symbiolongicarpus]|uniref:RAC-beta serine/threonine-protein kinase-like n=1 Tax=Hydractinia symbiolongicarpus TaxID=13093 RepID=UPI0025513305|nr:RAC-beta serine/threonine-protein kinase-like [Hydractinia symbiolongicarpus]